MRSISVLMTKAILVGVLLLSPFLGKSNEASASSAVVSGAVGDVKTSALKSQNYTSPPSAAVSAPAAQTVFGAEMDQITTGRGLNQLVAANATWTRRNAVMWLDVEPTEGTYNWSALAGLDSELQNASSQGLQVVLIVRGTPSWAQKVAGHSCGAILPTKLAAFGNFMHALVARYSVAPYNVKYWELWNEEDVDPSLVPADSVFGCWGDGWDPYYGGGYYAEMLKVVYPQIKSVDSQAQVMVGGLLLFCDPAPGSGCEAVNNNKRPSKFLEGILLNNGGPYFDGVSFHAYDYYDHESGKYSDPYWQTAWNTTGPVLNAKVQFLRSVLSQYGVSDKFLMNTEVGLLCDTCSSNDPVFEATKASYVAQAYSSAIAQGLRANMWYSLLGWFNSGLLDSSLNPLPAYTAFQFSRTELQDAVAVRRVTEYAGVDGYELQRGNSHIWVLWSLDGAAHLVNLPYAPVAAWDVSGNSVTPAASMNIDLKPLYLEWNNVSFTDVPVGYWAASFIERLYNAGITGGCSITPLMYCPDTEVTRSQMAVFLLRGEHGSAYSPPAATGTVFGDVPSNYWAAAYIERLAAEGITVGCGSGNYCPETVVSRDQMAVFLLRAEHGASYSPPPATGVFTDVPVGYWADRFVEQLALEGITSGCGTDTYCPAIPVTRAQMAVFLVRTFNLP